MNCLNPVRFSGTFYIDTEAVRDHGMQKLADPLAEDFRRIREKSPLQTELEGIAEQAVFQEKDLGRYLVLSFSAEDGANLQDRRLLRKFKQAGFTDYFYSPKNIAALNLGGREKIYTTLQAVIALGSKLFNPE